jgi:hypothetical protein
MVEYPPTLTPATPAGPTFTEVLPDGGGGAIRWTPADPSDPPAAGDLPPAGLLRIDQRRASCHYTVTEFPTGWDGRAFHLAKPDGESGTDPEAGSYDVFVGRNPADRTCQCKGFERWGRCKHVLACRALIENGWV